MLQVLNNSVCIGLSEYKCYFIFFFFFLVYFRQKKLEKVMEEEGLKDEEVIYMGLVPGFQREGYVFFIKLALVPGKRLAPWQEFES